jgi:hypothetical protein
MKIAKFTYSGPDEDGELFFDMEEATIENDTEYVIELIKTSCLMTNADGICVGGIYDSEQDTLIDPRESGSIHIDLNYIKAASFGGRLNKMTAIIYAVLFRRDSQKMGELSVPEDHETCSFLEKKVNVGGIVDIMGATCKREKSDGDGDVEVGLDVGVRNVTDEYIDNVSVKMALLDQEDSQIEVSENRYDLQPHMGRVFSPSVCTKERRLRNATIRVSVSVYLPVGFKTVEKVAVKELEENEDFL